MTRLEKAELIREVITILEIKRENPRASVITDMPGSPSFNADSMVNDLIRIEKLKEMLEELEKN